MYEAVIISGLPFSGKDILIREFCKKHADKFESAGYSLGKDGSDDVYEALAVQAARIQEKKKVPILELDTPGKEKILSSPFFKHRRVCSIFVICNPDVLINRLNETGSFSKEEALNILGDAYTQAMEIGAYDHVVNNSGDISDAVAAFERYVEGDEADDPVDDGRLLQKLLRQAGLVALAERSRDRGKKS